MVSNVTHFRPQDPAEAAEFDAFLRMLPGLRVTHGGQYVVVCGGEVIASGFDLDTVDRTVKPVARGRPIYYGWVEPPDGFVAFSGLFEVREEVA